MSFVAVFVNDWLQTKSATFARNGEVKSEKKYSKTFGFILIEKKKISNHEFEKKNWMPSINFRQWFSVEW